MDCPFQDVQLVPTPVFFIYIGFSFACFTFLLQYLTFPKSLFIDLTNMKVSGYPRIMARPLREMFNARARKIISYFFQLDYVTYALLMYIVYSLAVVLLLTLKHFGLLWDPRIQILVVTLLFVACRGVLIYFGAFKKGKTTQRRYKRGHEFWTRKERRSLLAAESVVWAVLLFGVIYSIGINRGVLTFVWLVVVLILMLAGHLLVTLLAGPVTLLLSMWTDLANEDAERPLPADQDGEPLVT